jgi:hypothetical protein
VKALIVAGSRPEIANSVRRAIEKLATKNKRAQRKGAKRLMRRAHLAGLPATERWELGDYL